MTHYSLLITLFETHSAARGSGEAFGQVYTGSMYLNYRPNASPLLLPKMFLPFNWGREALLGSSPETKNDNGIAESLDMISFSSSFSAWYFDPVACCLLPVACA
ncbi:MAG: hypothetical protein F6K31_00215 [Symploca sp. SIO2G7]|nr:hypothetical protein [Symploca sp. SIO2G7]